MSPENVPTDAADASPIAHSRRWRRWLLGIVVIGLLAAWPQLSSWYALRQVRSALSERDADRAQRWLEQAQAWTGETAETSLLQARIYRRKGLLNDLQLALTRALRAGAPREKVQAEEWLAQAQSGQLRSSLPHLSDLLVQQQVDINEVCEAYIGGYLLNHRYVEALRLADNWVNDFPAAAYPRMVRAQAHKAARHEKQASEEFAAAHQMDPSDPAIAIALADSLVETKQHQAAIPLYQQARQRSDLASRAVLGLAVCWKVLGRPGDAIQILAERLKEDPSNIDLQFELGRDYLDEGQPEEAVRLLRPALDKAPGNIELRYALAQSLSAVGMKDEAARQFAKVEQGWKITAEVTRLQDEAMRAPQNIELRIQIGQKLSSIHQDELALIWLHSVLDLDPAHPEAHRLLAEYYERKAADDPSYAPLARQHRQASGK